MTASIWDDSEPKTSDNSVKFDAVGDTVSIITDDVDTLLRVLSTRSQHPVFIADDSAISEENPE